MVTYTRGSLIGLRNNSSDEEIDKSLNTHAEILNDDDVTDNRKFRGAAKRYEFQQEYATIGKNHVILQLLNDAFYEKNSKNLNILLELAEKAIEEENTWSLKAKKYEKKTKTKKIFYRCNKVLQRAKIQCSTGLVIIFPPDKTTVEIHRTMCAHDHNPRKFAVSLDARDRIAAMFKITQLLTPSTILLNLQSANDDRLKIIQDNILRVKEQKPPLPVHEEIQIPKVKDLYNYLATFRKNKFGHSNMNLGELNSWCLDHEEVPPENEPDLPFIVKFQMYYPDETYTQEDEHDSPKDQFRFYITTRRLIEFSTNFTLVLQTDGTYKLTWLGNAILIVGSSDFDRIFHPVGLACCSREAQ